MILSEMLDIYKYDLNEWIKVLIVLYCLCKVCYVKYPGKITLVHPFLKLALDQLLGEGPDHKNLRILFDLGWPWKTSPGFTPHLEKHLRDWVILAGGFRCIWILGPKPLYPKLYGVSEESVKTVSLILCIWEEWNKVFQMYSKWIGVVFC